MTTFTEAFRAERRSAASIQRPSRTPLTVRAGRLVARVLPRWSAVRTAVLSVGGLGLITVAAWQLHLALGLAVGGVSLLLLEALSGGDRR